MNRPDRQKGRNHMTPEEIIRKYGITLHDETHLSVTRSRVKTKQDNQLIVENKPAILAVLLEEKREKERKAAERQSKIDAIEGLKEIRAASRELNEFYDRYNEAVVNGYGILPVKPDIDLDALKAKYPRAAAYLKAESYKNAAHYQKSSAGRKALERIINGEPHETVIAEMEREWTDAAMSHIWD